jgi:hypothetical protein
VAGLFYFLRRRQQRAAAQRAANQVYPEEAYLYDPPITPPPETAERGGAPQLGPVTSGNSAGGIFVTREFGTNANGNSQESFHTASTARNGFGNGFGNGSTNTPNGGEGLASAPTTSREPLLAPQSPPGHPLDSERTGLIPAAAGVAGASAAPNFSQPRAFTGTAPSSSYSPTSPRYVSPTGESAFPAASSARPVAYGLGVSTQQAASHAAQVRSRDFGETDPAYAVSPTDIRRQETTPLSPEGDMGVLGANGKGPGADGVTYGGGVYPGAGRARQSWGW